MRSGARLNFIDTNPAITGISQAQQLQSQGIQNDLGQLRYAEARRTADAEAAVDQALRDWASGQGGGATGMPADLSTAVPAGPAAAPAAPTAPAPAMPQTGTGPSVGAMPKPAAPATNLDTGNAPIGGGPAQLDTGNSGFGGGPAQLDTGNAPIAQPAVNFDYNVGRPQSPTKLQSSFDRVALAKRLALMPGGGAAALQQIDKVDQQQRADREHALTNFFAAMKDLDTTGNPDAEYSARYWASQAGQELPDSVVKNGDAVRFMAKVGDYQGLYQGDPQGFHDFYQAALKLHGQADPQAFDHAYAAHPPKVKPIRYSYQDKLDLYDALRKRGWQDEDAKVAAFGYRNVRGAGAGGNAVWQTKQNAWLKLHPGDEQGAMDYADGRIGMSEKDATQAAVSVLKEEMGPNGNGLPKGTTSEQRITELKQFFMSNSGQRPTLDVGGADAGGAGGDVASQMQVPDENDPNVGVAMINGRKAVSSDGQTWYWAGTNELVQ